MLKELLRKLARKNARAAQQAANPAPPAPQKEPRYKLGNGFYWEFDQVSNSMGGYKTVSAYLLNMDDPSFKRCIVNSAGEIQNFPGFADSSWKKALDFPFDDNKVRFTFWISPFSQGKAPVRWLIQPDGRYFEDEDGFGAEHCAEIEMYSELDENGQFTRPFSL